MQIHTTPESAESAFFDALLHRDVEELRALLVDDFLLIDVMSGSKVRKGDLLDVLAGGQLFFASEVARMHKRRDKVGGIRLENGGMLGGGCFVLTLP